MTNEIMNVFVKQKYAVAKDIVAFELVAEDGADLPDFTAGSHIDVYIQDTIRQYSISSSPAKTHHYILGIKRELEGRGGSLAMCDEIEEGDLIKISRPKNNFHLDETAAMSYLFAGGIGITPMLCMAYRLHELNKPFEFHYSCRSEEAAAFKEAIRDSGFSKQVYFHFSEGENANRLDANQVIPAYKNNLHLYVCGPQAYMQYVIDTAEKDAGWPEASVHREYFAVENIFTEDDGLFEVKLNNSGETYTIPADQTIAEVLEEHDVDIPLSCEQGVCGTCMTSVLEGLPDHRDQFLTNAEKEENNKIMICCSRAKTSLLVLDL